MSKRVKEITLKDIAGIVNVSKTVVSHAVNDRPNGTGNVSIRPELRARIKEVARQMNYRPNRNAQALRTGRSKTIGVLTTPSYYQTNYIKTYHICEEISRRGYNYFLYQIEFDRSEIGYERALDALQEHGVEGCIIVNLMSDDITEAEIACFERIEYPLVDSSRAFPDRLPFVGADDYEAFRKMTAHVIDKGCRDLHMITVGSYSKGKAISRRVEGVKDACAAAPEASFSLYNCQRELQLGEEATYGYESTLELLRSARPEAILYCNDLLALGGLKALHDRGIRVPEDMLVCGFDGLELAKLANPPLTTAVQPIREIAEKLVAVLFAAIEDKDEIWGQYWELPCRLIHRESTGDCSSDCSGIA